MSSLCARKVVITGGSRGIGAAIARAVIAQGATAALIARDQQSLDALSQELGVPRVRADLADPGAAARAVEEAATLLGGIDVLVNNAGIFQLGPVATGTHSDWRSMLEINVLGLLAATQAAIPHLAASPNGQLVNISSLSGRRVPGPAQGVYAGTKHAVHAISDGLRQELHSDGIRVTVIAPGVVDTNRGSYITDPAAREAAETGQREWGLHPDEVAAQVLHVLSAPADVHLTEISLMSTRQPPR